MTQTYDVVVVGFGYAGGIAALAAHDLGARVVIVEKRADPGGISVCSAGGVRCTSDPAAALAYLEATNAGTTPRAVLRVLADGMSEMPQFVAALATAAGAIAVVRSAPGNYPFPGSDAFGFATVDDIAGFDSAAEFPSVRGSPAGARLFKVVLENVRRRGIEVRLACPAERLLRSGERVVGVSTPSGDIMARGGIVLCTGGFEGDAGLQRQFWPMQNVLSAAIRTNTGDGLRLAQSAGASLWHMWHYHGSYGFRHPNPSYPFGVRLKRLPDWRPGDPWRDDVTMSWILVNRSGRRFMNEYEPYMQDTGHRPFEQMDFAAARQANAPAILIVDEPGRRRYPLSAPTWHDDEVATHYREASAQDFDAAILRRFDTVHDLAAAFDCPADTLAASIADWNARVEAPSPDPWGRPVGSRAAVRVPPFSAAEVWPIVSNTQGGPAHDERQRVLDAYGDPILGLYEAGEIGSVFGHIYVSGGNLAECFVGGRVAGREAALAAKNEGRAT